MIQVFLMLAQKPRTMTSLPSPGIRHPILKAQWPTLKASKAERQTGEATEEVLASYADDQ